MGKNQIKVELVKVVVDTNIVFSAILKANSSIAKYLLSSSYFESELIRVIKIISGRIAFIDVQSIPEEVYRKVKLLTADIDTDDTKFVALAEYLNIR
ncbi:MAG: hypothetical protein ACRYGB_04790 [Janthinobacterium lividum]